jgi:hypothetical protein
MEADIAQFETMMRTMREQFNKEIDKNEDIKDPAARDAIKSAASDWFDALEATVKAGEIDGGAAVQLGSDTGAGEPGFTAPAVGERREFRRRHRQRRGIRVGWPKQHRSDQESDRRLRRRAR